MAAMRHHSCKRVDNKAKQAALGGRHPTIVVHQTSNEDRSSHAQHHGYQDVLPAAPQTKGSQAGRMSARGPPGARGCTRMPHDDQWEGAAAPRSPQVCHQ